MSKATVLSGACPANFDVQMGTGLNDIVTQFNLLRTWLLSDGIINATTVAIDATPEDFQIAACQYRIDGVSAAKAAATGISFSAADTINTGAAATAFWGVWLIQIDIAGTVSTKPGGGLSDQVYTTEALAIAALPAADAANVGIGYLTVNNNVSSAWTANTDDMTGGSDCVAANFYSTASTIPAAVSTTWLS